MIELEYSTRKKISKNLLYKWQEKNLIVGLNLTHNDETRATHWNEEKRDETSGSISSLGTHIFYGRPIREGSLKQDVSSLSLGGHVFTRHFIYEKALANTKHLSRVQCCCSLFQGLCGWETRITIHKTWEALFGGDLYKSKFLPQAPFILST